MKFLFSNFFLFWYFFCYLIFHKIALFQYIGKGPKIVVIFSSLCCSVSNWPFDIEKLTNYIMKLSKFRPIFRFIFVGICIKSLFKTSCSLINNFSLYQSKYHVSYRDCFDTDNSCQRLFLPFVLFSKCSIGIIIFGAHLNWNHQKANDIILFGFDMTLSPNWLWIRLFLYIFYPFNSLYLICENSKNKIDAIVQVDVHFRTKNELHLNGSFQ